VSVYSTIEVATTLTGMPFAVVGFGITIYQSMKAKSAAESARDAAREAAGNMRRASLLVLIPQMQRVEDELEQAVRGGSVSLSISWLSTWRWQAGQARGFLAAAEDQSANQGTLIALQASMTAARNAKAKLIESSASPDVVVATRAARGSIGKATEELSALAANYGIQLGSSTNG
jgi:hypothetical protein